MAQPTDAELVGPNGKDTVFALVDGIAAPSNGSVVYMPAVVAATGQMQGGRQTAYVVGLDGPEPPDLYGFDPDNAPTVPHLLRAFAKHH